MAGRRPQLAQRKCPPVSLRVELIGQSHPVVLPPAQFGVFDPALSWASWVQQLIAGLDQRIVEWSPFEGAGIWAGNQ